MEWKKGQSLRTVEVLEGRLWGSESKGARKEKELSKWTEYRETQRNKLQRDVKVMLKLLDVCQFYLRM